MVDNTVPPNDKDGRRGPVYDVYKVPQPKWDPVFSTDRRIIEDLISTDLAFKPDRQYFSIKQDDMQPWMRNMVACWMKEVCEEQNAEVEVYPMAMQLFDRFLSCEKHERSRLQLLGTACIFLASKIKETVPFSVEKLVMFTDYSFTKEQVLQMELIISRVLDFDLSSSTPFDFLLPLMDVLRAKNLLTKSLACRLHQECQSLVTCLVAEEFYLHYPAASFSASCIAVVAAHVLKLSAQHSTRILNELGQELQIFSTDLNACCAVVESFFLKNKDDAQQENSDSLNKFDENVEKNADRVDSLLSCSNGTYTPTDTREVLF